MNSQNFAFSAFTFDTASGVLTRNGRILRLPRQTSLLLAILLERAGSVVTREEIQRHLWPDREFIDHEQAINRAINHLRTALRDNHRKARFIETFPKQGYRFSAPLELLPPTPANVTLVKALTDIPEPGPSVEDALVLSPPLEHPLPARPAETPRPARVWTRPLAWAVVLCVAAAGAVGAYVSVRRTTLPSVISIGIAPFDAQTEDERRLGESFRLDLMDTLSQLPGVQLRASHSLENLKRDELSLQQASRDLHLDLILLGKLTLQGSVCTLEFELVRGRDAVHLASLQYTGAENELTTIRDKVQHDIFADLRVTEKPVQALKGSTVDPEAYGDYLRGKELAYRRTQESLAEAIPQYKAAIARDPNFARAYAGLATAYLANFNFSNSPLDHTRSRLSAQQALTLDPELAEAHAVLGLLAFREDWNFAEGERELRHAVELEPHQTVYHAWLATTLTLLGRTQEALREVDLAHQDDPLWPLVYNIEIPIAGYAHDDKRAFAAARRYEELVPDSPFAIDDLAWLYFDVSQYEDAIAQWRRMATIENDAARVALEDRGLEAFRRGGISAYAAVRLQASLTDPQRLSSHHPNDFSAAEWYAYTGNRDRAIVELQNMVNRHDDAAIDLAINPMFRSLHKDPRFLTLVSQMGFTPHASGTDSY